jgi:hypothetical protein
MQSKKHSAYEALTNTVLGTMIGYCIVLFAFPLIGGVPVSPTQAIYGNVMFIVASTLRSYTVRRGFVWLSGRDV